MTPAWILDIFAAIMLVVAAISAARLVAARPWRRGAFVTDTDISHLLMGIAMAGMLTPGLATLPNDAWAAVFGVLAAWFAYRVVRDYRANGTQAPFGSVVRLAVSMPAMAMPMSRCEMSVSVTTAPRCHGRAATSRAALTAATTSMIAANMSRIQAGIITLSLRQLRAVR